MTITNIENHGSIVIMDVGETRLYWDHRQYGHFLEALADEQGIEPDGTVDLTGDDWDTDGTAVWREE